MNIETLRAFVMELPFVTEDIKWERDLCFCIGKKMFCVTELDQPVFKVSIKVLQEEFEILTERKGIIPAPYLARFNWILIEEESSLSINEWQYYISQSYELVKNKLPKKYLKH